MISSFFDKTKPINFLVLLGAIFILYWGISLIHSGFEMALEEVLLRSTASAALVLTVFILGDMVKIKKLTGDNSFAMLFYVLLLLTFHKGLMNTHLVFCCFFLMIAANRALALKEEKKQKEKVFESALWLLVASLFVDWALLFVLALYVAISLFCSNQLRLWLMPLAALVCFGILGITIAVLLDTPSFFLDHYRLVFSFDFFLKPNIGIVIYIIFAFVMAFLVFGKLGYRRLGRTLSLRLIFMYLLLGVLLLLFINKDDKGIEMFSFFPLALFMANFIETVKKQRVKEILVIVVIILPLLGLAIGATQ